jgi:hypothetical protein
MVGHKTVSPNFNPPAHTPLGNQREIILVIIFAKEGGLSSVAPLGYMMGDAHCHRLCYSRHERMIPQRISRIKN